MNDTLFLDNLIHEISNGDRNALGNLYDVTSSNVFGYALSIIRCKSKAEDIMQDTYIQIHKKAKLYKSQGKAMAWILRITRNLAYNALKKQKKEVSLDIDFGYQTQQMFDENEVLDKLILNEVLTKLSIGERQVVILYLLVGMSQKDISKTMGIPLPTVKWRYKSALNKLYKIINLN